MPTPSKFVSKEQWGSSSPDYPNASSHPIGDTDGITCHWEGPGMGGFPHRLCARKVRAIERFHVATRGWAGIAYNALVCPHGWVFEGRGVWTMSAANGNTYVNGRWYAVCYLSGKGDRFTAAAKVGFRAAFAWLATEGGAGPRRNGHRDHKPTECPGDVIYRWVHSTDFSTPIPTSEEDDMPFTDWPKKDQDALAETVAKVINRESGRVQLQDRDQPNIKRSRDGLLLEGDKKLGVLVSLQRSAAERIAEATVAAITAARPDIDVSAADVAAELIRQLTTEES